MTRYARAKGSKASNQKLPEDATPWSELKKQISQKKDEDNQEPAAEKVNWKNIINTEKKVEENVNSVWCEFDEPKDKSKKKERKRKRAEAEESTKPAEGEFSKTPKKSKVLNDVEQADTFSKKTKERKIKQFDVEPADTFSKKTKERKIKQLEVEADDPKDIFTKKPKKNNVAQEVTESELKDEEGIKQNKKSKNWSVTGKEFRKAKFKSEPYQRRKQDPGDQVLNLHGQEVVVTKLDGFYICKDDADRIRGLEKDLLKRGVPKEEIRAVIKRERRGAEKNLARLKKKTCFHCRQGGHNLSECPKLSEGGANIGSGICYKCGSTEHSHLQCRVTTGDSYKFAVCFICKEEGHISRQCPDNPRGLYPAGGGCRLCGEVTHFKKDCPTQVKEKVTVGTLGDNIEALTELDQPQQNTESANKKPKNKIIKFK